MELDKKLIMQFVQILKEKQSSELSQNEIELLLMGKVHKGHLERIDKKIDCIKFNLKLFKDSVYVKKIKNSYELSLEGHLLLDKYERAIERIGGIENLNINTFWKEFEF